MLARGVLQDPCYGLIKRLLPVRHGPAECRGELCVRDHGQASRTGSGVRKPCAKSTGTSIWLLGGFWEKAALIAEFAKCQFEHTVQTEGPTSSIGKLPDASLKIDGIVGFPEQGGTRQNLVRREIPEFVGDLLWAHDLHALPVFDRADERRGIV